MVQERPYPSSKLKGLIRAGALIGAGLLVSLKGYCLLPPQQTFVPPQDYQVIEPEPLIDEALVRKVIPLNLNPNADHTVAPRIIDYSLQNIMNTSTFKQNSALRAVSAIENKMKTDFTVKNDDPKGIDHKFSFQMNAIQREAHFFYSGLTNCKVRLNFESSQMLLELKEKISTSQELVVNHNQIGSGESRQYFGWRYRW